MIEIEGCREGDRQDEAGRGDAGPDAAGGTAHEARTASTRGKNIRLCLVDVNFNPFLVHISDILVNSVNRPRFQGKYFVRHFSRG